MKLVNVANNTVLCLFISSLTAQSLFADEIDNCIAAKQAAFEQPKAFSKSGKVTCPSGDIVGFPPRSRKHDRNSTLTYNTPDGFVLKNTGINSVSATPLSSNNGYVRAVDVKSNTEVSVDFGCRGKSPGQGRAWQEVKLQGTIVREASQDQLKDWIIQCVRG